MATDLRHIEKDLQDLAAGVETLRSRLEQETANAAKLREEYGTECRRLARGEHTMVTSVKQRLDLATCRIEGIKAEIATKERVLDEIQGREAEESRARQAQENYRRANERLAESQAELARLKAEYSAMPETIMIAQGRFSEALRAFNEAKSACFKDQSD